MKRQTCKNCKRDAWTRIVSNYECKRCKDKGKIKDFTMAGPKNFGIYNESVKKK